MKKISVLLIAFTLISLSLLQSCKYEEGPALSLRTKKSRITGTWKVEKITEKDGDIYTPDENNNIRYSFNKSGTGDYIFKIFGITTSQLLDWEFTNSKKRLKITYENGDVVNTEILRLTNEQLIVLTTDGDRWELDKQ